MSVIKVPPRKTDLQNGVALRCARDMSEAGDVICPDEGVFDLSPDGPFRLPPGVSCIGLHRDLSVLVNTYHSLNLVNEGANFELADGVMYARCTLRATFANNQQMVLVGFAQYGDDPSKQIRNARAKLEDCWLGDATFVVYCWVGSGNSIDVNRSVLFGPRWLVTQGVSSAGNGCSVNVSDSILIGNSAGTTHVGAQGLRLHAFSARGGVVRSIHNMVKLVAGPNMKDCRAMWIPLPSSPPGVPVDYEGSAPDTVIEVYDTHSQVSGSPNRWDADGGNGRITWVNGSGSLPDRKIMTKATPPGKVEVF